MTLSPDEVEQRRKKVADLGRKLSVAEAKREELRKQLKEAQTEIKKLCAGKKPDLYLRELETRIEELRVSIDDGTAKVQTALAEVLD